MILNALVLSQVYLPTKHHNAFKSNGFKPNWKERLEMPKSSPPMPVNNETYFTFFPWSRVQSLKEKFLLCLMNNDWCASWQLWGYRKKRGEDKLWAPVSAGTCGWPLIRRSCQRKGLTTQLATLAKISLETRRMLKKLKWTLKINFNQIQLQLWGLRETHRPLGQDSAPARDLVAPFDACNP